jgi:pyruvate kinase
VAYRADVKRTKIVCTIGPASRDSAVIEALIREGMDVARLNLSHGKKDDHRAAMTSLFDASKKIGRPIAVLQDLQGPKIRVTSLTGGRMQLVEGAELNLVYAPAQPDEHTIPTGYAELARDVHAGATILLDDGLLRLRVLDSDGETVRCKVEVGGILKDRKGINLPGVNVSAPALTQKDLDDLSFGVELGVDFVCLSFVRAAADVRQAKERLASLSSTSPVIAKIEKPQAVAALGEILDAADGIMVARGDLGVELGPEKVPLIQKHCIEEANRRGKLVITATQMLESMVTSSFPTRAEASDVANAVLDQTDAVMLSAETATGNHPPLVVRTMARIIEEIESSDRYRKLADLPPLDLGMTANAIAHAAAAAASSLRDIAAVACISHDGGTATLLSDYRPQVPVFAFTASECDCRRLAAFWGVDPVRFAVSANETADEVLTRIEEQMAARGITGGSILVTMSIPVTAEGHTNTIHVHQLGSRR